MAQTAFYPTLEEFTSKYFVARTRPLTPAETAQRPAKLFEVQTTLFEQLLLFDTLAIKIRGENLPLLVLLRLLGEKRLEELIEQSAIRFIQWKPTVFHMVTELPGIDALASGNIDSPAYDDPERSIDLSFKFYGEPLSKRTQKMLRRKAAPLYEVPAPDLAAKAVGLTKSAYNSGKLTPFKLPPDEPFDRLPLAKRERLNTCATELLEYDYAIGHGMTSLSNYAFFSLLTDTAGKLRRRTTVRDGFNELAKLEAFPDLKSLYAQLANPLLQMPKLRAKRRSQKFREWLAETTEGRAELSAEYIASIANAHGFLDTTGGKYLKAIAMTAISAAAGGAVGAVVGAALAGTAVGGIAAKVVEPGVDLGLDLLDEFVLDGLLKGWSPRVFFDDLRELEHPDLRGPKP